MKSVQLSEDQLENILLKLIKLTKEPDKIGLLKDILRIMPNKYFNILEEIIAGNNTNIKILLSKNPFALMFKFPDNTLIKFFTKYFTKERLNISGQKSLYRIIKKKHLKKFTKDGMLLPNPNARATSYIDYRFSINGKYHEFNPENVPSGLNTSSSKYEIEKIYGPYVKNSVIIEISIEDIEKSGAIMVKEDYTSIDSAIFLIVDRPLPYKISN